MISFLTFSSSKSIADGPVYHGLNYTDSAEKLFRIWLSRVLETFRPLCDCLNVSNTLESQMKRRPAIEPYIDRNDWPVKVFSIS